MRGFLSTSFSQPLGGRVVPGELRGYYVDLRVKAATPAWPPADLDPLERQLHVDVIQWGLGAWEHYLDGGRDEWLEAACKVGEHLLVLQERRGPLDGGWVHRFPYPHTFRLDPPWLSAMAQGEGASLLLRLARETDDSRFMEAAARASRPLLRTTADRGVQAVLGGGPILEEYPTEPPSFVLNGAIFALWGCFDLELATGDGDCRRLFGEGVETLAANLQRWDTGWWSRYDLFPHRFPNIASPAYHELHVIQLTALDRLAPKPELRATIERWRRYGASRLNRARAFAAKAAFRAFVPRSPALARRLPWVRQP